MASSTNMPDTITNPMIDRELIVMSKMGNKTSAARKENGTPTIASTKSGGAVVPIVS